VAVYLRNATRGTGVDTAALVAATHTILNAIGEPVSSLSLSLVRDAEIRKLNATFRGKDAATDVLSFSLVEGEAPSQRGERMLGDVVISVDTALRQARDYDATLDEELRRLLIHGVLHLIGHDHEEAADAKRMRAQERRLAKAIGLAWPY